MREAGFGARLFIALTMGRAWTYISVELICGLRLGMQTKYSSSPSMQGGRIDTSQGMRGNCFEGVVEGVGSI